MADAVCDVTFLLQLPAQIQYFINIYRNIYK